MTIAIAADSTDPQGLVSRHAARAAYYLIYDNNGDLLKAIENPGAQVERGAGPTAALFLQQQGVSTIIAAEFGSRFTTELEAEQITASQANGTIATAIHTITNQ